MMRFPFILFSVCLLGIAACNKEEIQRERLDGYWIYDKAKMQDKTFSRTDIFDDYRYIDLYFTSDGGLKILNVLDSSYYEGQYTLAQDNTSYTDADGNTTTVSKTQMAIAYTDTSTKENFVELWDQVEIGKNKICFEQRLGKKDAFFTLRRQLD